MWHGMVRHLATDMCPRHGNAKGHFKYGIQLPAVSCQPLSNEMMKCVPQVCLASVIAFPHGVESVVMRHLAMDTSPSQRNAKGNLK